jgi:HSP20 family protein
MADKDLQVQEKQEVQSGAEATRNVPVYVPAVDIYETENDLTVLADMPGVTKDNVDIDLTDDKLTIRGSVETQGEGENMLLREFRVGDYYRQFTLGKTIDREKIEAGVTNGVLKIVLPKADAAKPRKIEVKAG